MLLSCRPSFGPVGRFAALLAATLLAGCGDGRDSGFGGDTDYMDDQPPSGSCVPGGTGSCTGGSSSTGATGGSSSTGLTTGADGDACKFSADCPAGQICVAPFDGDRRQPYACVAPDACVPEAASPEAAAWWCADDLACCDANATCSDRGLCVVGTGTSTSTGSGGTTDTGTGG